jgi:hypothetical protein
MFTAFQYDSEQICARCSIADYVGENPALAIHYE